MNAARAASLPVQLREPLSRIADDIDRLFDETLSGGGPDGGQLLGAMRHAAMGGGKRLRPLLVLASGSIFGAPGASCVRAGFAVECLHVQSLIHDDLPCMDDDDLRRGRPTVHVAYDEATAVLAGDALLALAFEIVCDPATHSDAEIRTRLAASLAGSAGAWGMAGGQMLDLRADLTSLDLDGITRLQRLKTGALIEWSVDAGAILGSASSDARTSLRGYARNLGLAFQIADDLLDACGDEAAVGKRLRKDPGQGKQSFVSLLGEEEARRRALMLVEQAIEHLRPFGQRADLLADIARYSIQRDR